jgi:hypothetical protein
MGELADDEADGKRNRGTSSKYTSALTPTRPTFARSRIEAMPCTMVQKITGAIIILIRPMNASPSGLSAAPVFGKK